MTSREPEQPDSEITHRMTRSAMSRCGVHGPMTKYGAEVTCVQCVEPELRKKLRRLTRNHGPGATQSQVLAWIAEDVRREELEALRQAEDPPDRE